MGLENNGPPTATFATLRLNRKPLTTGFLTWGPALHYVGSNELYTGPHYWRALPRRTYDESQSSRNIPPIIEGSGNPEFEHDRAQLLAEIESNIKRYPAADPRWGVFLLHRVGHHEWEPEDTQSPTRALGSTWEGAWALQKEARDWASPMTTAGGRALIARNGDDFQITVVADHEADPFVNVEKCNLRYSGASTYKPEPGPNGQNPRNTVFGYVAYPAQVAGAFSADGANKEAVAPLDAARSYRQVLMLCAGGESLDSARVRFLLLADDTLIEVGASDPFHGPLSIRHYHRVQR